MTCIRTVISRRRRVRHLQRRRRELKLARPCNWLGTAGGTKIQRASSMFTMLSSRENSDPVAGAASVASGTTDARWVHNGVADDVEDSKRAAAPVRRLRDVIHPQRKGVRESLDGMHRGEEPVDGGQAEFRHDIEIAREVVCHETFLSARPEHRQPVNASP